MFGSLDKKLANLEGKRFFLTMISHFESASMLNFKILFILVLCIVLCSTVEHLMLPVVWQKID